MAHKIMAILGKKIYMYMNIYILYKWILPQRNKSKTNTNDCDELIVIHYYAWSISHGRAIRTLK